MAIISIIGCGWLGWPLAQTLSTTHHVFASKTSQQSLTQTPFSHSNLQGFVAKLSSQDKDITQLESALQMQQPDIIIGCFPPGFRQGHGKNYTRHWQVLVNIAQKIDVQRQISLPNAHPLKLIMVSSTSVYPNIAQQMQETDASVQRYHACTTGFSDKSRVMLQAEQAVIDSQLDYTIIRCSGLLGPSRLPHRFVRHLKQISDCAPVNMLHQDDAVNIITYACRALSKQVVNASTPDALSKLEFYQHALDLAHNAQPCSDVDEYFSLPNVISVADKQINSQKLIKLGYRFRYSTYHQLLAQLYPKT